MNSSESLELLAGVVAMASDGQISLSPVSGSSTGSGSGSGQSSSEITAQSVPSGSMNRSTKRKKSGAHALGKGASRGIHKKEKEGGRLRTGNGTLPRKSANAMSVECLTSSMKGTSLKDIIDNKQLANSNTSGGSAPVETEDEDETPITDTRRALRAERNRQSAAASRERKKRHLKDLENRVQYLSEVNATVQYQSHMERTAWAEREKQLENEIAHLRTVLAEHREQLEFLRDNRCKQCGDNANAYAHR